MSKERLNFSRRRMLMGAGATVALPWLESLVCGGDAPTNDGFPRRLAVLFFGNGVHEPGWWIKGEGKEMELGDCLKPLQPFVGEFSNLDGLRNQKAIGVGIHPPQTGNLLTGMRCEPGPRLKNGISFDQVLARKIGQRSMLPSLVLTCEQPITGYHETKCSMAYSSHISWFNDTQPVPVEIYPAQVWDAMFDNRGSQRMKGVLDRVLSEARDLDRKLGHADKLKLDEYLTSLREVETRIERVRGEHKVLTDRLSDLQSGLQSIPRPRSGLPEDLREHCKLMMDLIAIAFQANLTQLATCILCRDLSFMYYPFLNVKQAHHLASHSYRSEDYKKINIFHVEQYAYLLQKLRSMPEGDGTVLDNSLVVFLSNMWVGSHDVTKLPLLYAGKLGGQVKQGRNLNYLKHSDNERKLCSFYLSLMDRMGVQLPSFGDAQERLSDWS